MSQPEGRELNDDDCDEVASKFIKIHILLRGRFIIMIIYAMIGYVVWLII